MCPITITKAEASSINFKLAITPLFLKVVHSNETFNFLIIILEIYAKLQRNQVFEVAPIEVHFAGYELSSDLNEPKKYVQKLKIINISGQVQRLTVLPPQQTKYFDIHYVKPV
jgi:hypothetical protein